MANRFEDMKNKYEQKMKISLAEMGFSTDFAQAADVYEFRLSNQYLVGERTNSQWRDASNINLTDSDESS